MGSTTLMKLHEDRKAFGKGRLVAGKVKLVVLRDASSFGSTESAAMAACDLFQKQLEAGLFIFRTAAQVVRIIGDDEPPADRAERCFHRMAP